MIRVVSFAAGVLGTLVAASHAQTLHTLPSGASGLGGMSSNGEWVTGIDNFSGGAFIWSVNSGLFNAGETDGVAISDDGVRVLGNTTNGNGDDEAGQYNVVANSWSGLGTFTGGAACGTSLTTAYDMSDDGGAATGLAWENCGGRAFYWDGANVTKLPQWDGNSTRGNAVSGDGRYVGGWDQNNGGTRRAAIWDTFTTPPTEILPLVTPSNPTGAGETWAFSTNGRYAVGQASQPWLYDQLTGTLTMLGTLPGASPSDAGIARAVSDDGKTVVGLSGNSFFGTPWRAWIWTEAHGIQEMSAFLGAMGVPFNGNLYGAADMSADGRTILGAFANFIGFAGDGWVLELPPIENLGGSTTGFGGLDPVLSATGSMVSGTPFAMYLDDAAPNAASILFLSTGSVPTPLLGGTFFPVPVLNLVVVPTSAGGDWTLPTPWPAGVPAGLSITFQAAVPDGSATGGAALSNGLKITTP